MVRYQVKIQHGDVNQMLSGEQKQRLRQLPSVHRLLQDERLRQWSEMTSPRWVSDGVSQYLDNLRRQLLEGQAIAIPSEDQLIEEIIRDLKKRSRANFRRVINGTGVVLHTNLGRARIAEAACRAMLEVAKHFNNLEYNLEEGRRGSRYEHVEALLCQLTGAEAALVVNNNAAAVFLVLRELARGKEVIVSRGELVEIGGSFRISEIMLESGARLVEVGTTNKTHPEDYLKHITAETALLMKVHQSNFKTIGFTAEVDAAELVQMGREHQIPVYLDLGSGVLFDLRLYGIGDEPTVQEVVSKGVDLVSFSGDKLLGGPQAGIIVGRKPLIDRLKKNQLNRALRVDKFTLAALEATLRLYMFPEQAKQAIPTLHMILTPLEVLREKAESLQKLLEPLAGLAEIGIEKGNSEVGGGSLPGVTLPTWLVWIKPRAMSLPELEKSLRTGQPPVIGRLWRERFWLDMRTIEADEIADCADSLKQALQSDKGLSHRSSD